MLDFFSFNVNIFFFNFNFTVAAWICSKTFFLQLNKSVWKVKILEQLTWKVSCFIVWLMALAVLFEPRARIHSVCKRRFSILLLLVQFLMKKKKKRNERRRDQSVKTLEEKRSSLKRWPGDGLRSISVPEESHGISCGGIEIKLTAIEHIFRRESRKSLCSSHLK